MMGEQIQRTDLFGIATDSSRLIRSRTPPSGPPYLADNRDYEPLRTLSPIVIVVAITLVYLVDSRLSFSSASWVRSFLYY